jgi:hypothetical protein
LLLVSFVGLGVTGVLFTEDSTPNRALFWGVGAYVLVANVGWYWLRSLRRCPRCRAVGIEYVTEEERFECEECDWDESQQPETSVVEPMPLWKALAPLALPVAVGLWSVASRQEGQLEFEPVMAVAPFFGGVWLLWVAWAWERIPYAIRESCRPPHRATPAILGVVGVAMSGFILLRSALR